MPPSPAARASARTVLALSTVVAVALGTAGLAPWRPPPTSTVPPPAGPLASRAAPVRVTRSPVTSMRPPLPAAPLAVATLPKALSCPATATSLMALMRITPPSSPAGVGTRADSAGASGLTGVEATAACTTVASAGAANGPEAGADAAGVWALVVTSAPAATVTFLPLSSTLPPGTASWLPACSSRWPPWASSNNAEST